MNEELQKALTEILNGVLTAKDFMIAELPEVIQQLLIWKFYEHLIFCLVGIAIAIGVFIGFYIAYKSDKNNQIDARKKTDGSEYVFLGLWSFASLMLLMLLSNITWLQIWLAPKVYLIEYAASLTN